VRNEPEEPGSGKLFGTDPEWTGTTGDFNEEAKQQAADTAHRVTVVAAPAGLALLAWLLLRRGDGTG